MRSNLIYGLMDPRTQRVRYVGKSTTGLTRPKSHQCPSLLARDKTHKGNWIRKLRVEKLSYVVVVFETVDDKTRLAAAERHWIHVLREAGQDLTNLTDGGDGPVGRVVTEETRRKISLANTGKKHPHSAEHRRKIGDATRGRRLSAETRKKISAAMRAQYAKSL